MSTKTFYRSVKDNHHWEDALEYNWRVDLNLALQMSYGILNKNNKKKAKSSASDCNFCNNYIILS